VQPSPGSQSSDSRGDPSPVGAGAPQPLAPPARALGASKIAAWILGLLLFHTFHVASTLILPFVLAILAALTLMPVVRALERLRIPRPLGAALILGGLVATVFFGAQLLIEPATEWAGRMPEMSLQLERKLRVVRQPMEELAQVADSVERLASSESPGEAKVAVRDSSGLIDMFIARTQKVISTSVVTLVLLYFLLTAGDMLVRGIAGLAPQASQKARTVGTLRATEGEISRYLLTICAINIGLGSAVACALFLLEVPNALLWGVLAAAANFIPFLGSLAVGVLLAGVAVVTFDDWMRILAVPSAFVLLTSLEGFFLTPSIVGRSLRLNPIVIFSGILVASWLWGIPGSLVAVPMLVVLKLVCDRTPSLMPVGRALSG